MPRILDRDAGHPSASDARPRDPDRDMGDTMIAPRQKLLVQQTFADAALAAA